MSEHWHVQPLRAMFHDQSLTGKPTNFFCTGALIYKTERQAMLVSLFYSGEWITEAQGNSRERSTFSASAWMS